MIATTTPAVPVTRVFVGAQRKDGLFPAQYVFPLSGKRIKKLLRQSQVDALLACAWKRSDDGGRFEVRDTRDGSLWGCYAAGEEIL